MEESLAEVGSLVGEAILAAEESLVEEHSLAEAVEEDWDRQP